MTALTGKLEYYHTSMWDKRRSMDTFKNCTSVYYLTPDMESTSNAFGGQLARFKIANNDSIVINESKSGKFGRTLDAMPCNSLE